MALVMAGCGDPVFLNDDTGQIPLFCPVCRNGKATAHAATRKLHNHIDHEIQLAVRDAVAKERDRIKDILWRIAFGRTPVDPDHSLEAVIRNLESYSPHCHH